MCSFSTFEFTSFIMRLPPPPVPAGRGLRSFGSVGTGASSYVRVVANCNSLGVSVEFQEQRNQQ